MTNRLRDSLSPYLQQHAENPVHWQEWGAEAFAEARRRDVPVFLSIGYAACHWCHVMAHESFEDPELAALLNRDFVPVKVDREERPDVDAVYMAATQALTGQGGWPMSVWLTPEGEPFYAGTYFPPRPRQGMPGFEQVLTALSQAWQERRSDVSDSATEVARYVAAAQEGITGDLQLATALEQLHHQYDNRYGGFGAAPKFPPTLVLDALLAEGSPDSLQSVTGTLDAMINGGIHDQLGGGFARYSVDARWIVPHFEKMLYDNALLLGTLARASRVVDAARAEDYQHVGERLVGWLEREMLLAGGGFAASLDADSVDADGRMREGAYYVWTPAQLTEVLGEAAGPAAAAFGVSAEGSFEPGTSTLQRLGPTEPHWRESLLQRRASRQPPARDDKVVAAWNGWLVVSLVEAAMIWQQPRWLELAIGAADYLWQVHVDSDRVHRVSRNGANGTAPAIAEDHGAMAHGFGMLAAATGDPHWLQRAEFLLELADRRFRAEDGGWYDSAADHDLITRPRDLTDNVTPSGGSALLAAHRVLAALNGTGPGRLDAATATGAGIAARAPRFAGWWLRELLLAERRRAKEIAVVGDAPELLRQAWCSAPEGSVILSVAADRTEDFGLSRGRSTPSPAAWVCSGNVCQLPVGTVEQLQDQLG
ncbi:thioredoxin domain-containing protein [Naumannella halotolerans]|uniref:Spermatogenesis-associated protein 20-like TRX domain-containing protein n=1 Tax=Naumannella halotolerans TaxID=993414 RepID=A0A4R7J985_9ACTN|nr:thioredoxin domain-containing protein [Naumannella halotolerans]TDT33053.1 hypothetical protein CLV29_0649 [Naumannella halotolerans]